MRPFYCMRLPIGYDDFAAIIDNQLDLVDKTLFVKDVLDDTAQIALIVRPRRFGKTLNLSILHHFLAADVRGRQTAGMFDSFKIWQAGEAYQKQQGQWPVIAITFKDIKEDSYGLAYEKLRLLLASAYKQHECLRHSTKLSEDDQTFYRAVASGAASQAQLENALLTLTELLFKHHGKKPWLLIDEYDTPLHGAHVKNYYLDMVGLMRGLLGAALKNNPYLHRAVLTGILRIAKESLFSGLNNLEVYSLLRPQYSQHFGFTEAEVSDLLQRSGLAGKAVEIRDWYNGYIFGGNTVIYNPWSIVNCIKNAGKTVAYWLNTSDNKLVRDLLVKSKPGFQEQLEGLLRGEELARTIDENVVFGDLDKSEGAVWSLLLMSGYLKTVGTEELEQGTLCRLEVPNREVRTMYRQVFEKWLADGQSIDWYNEFLASLLTGDMAKFQARLQQILLETASFHDLAQQPEVFYHGLMLGLTASLYNHYETKSNRESGHGRYDFAAFPKDKSKLGIVIEFKRLATAKNESLDEEALQARLDELAQAALAQIATQGYLAEFQQRGINNVLQIGIAYAGKRFKLCYTSRRA